ncbi:MAG: acetylxylan esterase [Acidobacteriota bacterium]|nr:acetylxylan esterase [Acidobacteriota bacterium]
MRFALLLVFFLPPVLASGQTVEQVGAILELPVQSPEIVEFQLRQYLMKRVPPLPTPQNAREWEIEARTIRERVLEDVIFRGWPSDWVEAEPKFEDLGIIASGKGYRLRGLRYEIIPGFQTTALLYEPESLTGKVPAIVNVNGHTPVGNATGYKQIRCINYALRGMLALSLEWFNCGELHLPGNDHWYGGHMNLAGMSATGLFYLAMRKGLDYLERHPHVDGRRLGVTGLSGGAWQTGVLSGLDERVAAAAPVSGYFAFLSAIERNADVGDMEYNPPDLGIDYAHLTALRAPRPTLLMFSAEDNYYVGRAVLTKPYLYDQIMPFFALFGREEAFEWHENTDPGTHNYELDNRQQSYRFFSRHFGLPAQPEEIPVDAEVKTARELHLGIPEDNLTILGLARKLAAEIEHEDPPGNPGRRRAWAGRKRERLRELVRYRSRRVEHPWGVANTKKRGLESVSYRLQFDNGLSASAIWLKAIASPPDAPATIVLNDRGYAAAGSQVSGLLNQGGQVLALDLIFSGNAAPEGPLRPEGSRANDPALNQLLEESKNKSMASWMVSRPPSALYGQLLAPLGERPLGIRAAQLVATTRWLEETTGTRRVRLESSGIRCQVVALIAAALKPELFSQVRIRQGMDSLSHLYEVPVTYQQAPGLFCRDLYKEFDLDQLEALAESTEIFRE